ncbi:KilA-N domain-containing protein [Comamonadaceae bacterium OH3737_COT-264]|nr:KilA-N domain-containing protein [Comamonadaceae bacterium OH3737_COT-264]
MTSLAPFAIDEVAVRQHDGLFSLNDLHKASGNIEAQRPNQFLRIDQTKALIQELKTAQICAVKTKEGRNGGTYACRELVIAYAAWISAAFHLKVIRVFLDVAAPAQPTTITPSQQQHLKELVDLVVESGNRPRCADALIPACPAKSPAGFAFDNAIIKRLH